MSLFANIHVIVDSFNAKTTQILEKFQDNELFLLNHEDDTGIATQNHAEAFNKSMLDVRQLNPVLQVKSLVRHECKRWNDEYHRAIKCTSILPPGLTSKATYKEQWRLAAASTLNITFMGKVR